MTQTAAIIGGGVIGAGWAARFLLNGWNVRVFDPEPGAEERVGAIIDRARLALPGLGDVALPPEGELTFCKLMSETVAGAAWIQESVPERLELKQTIYQKLQEHAEESAILASSTSGFTPSELQAHSNNPGQILVAHPFNPVYLVPLVEVVHSGKNHPDMIDNAQEILSSLGMYPLRVRSEIPAHIADRLLEAVWREALWLVRDDVATTKEIDEAIRMGFGLRWAQMGLFETYRIAGGPGGMAQFMAQFGPALKWPWTKLMDVPELTDELIHKIAEQSDDQSGHLSLDDLQSARDRNLVGIMRSLMREGWGAGDMLNKADRAREAGRAMARQLADIADLSQPVLTMDRAVPLDWLDYNGHMTEGKYLHAFGNATDRIMEIIGCDPEYVAAGKSFFTVETHIRHIDEVKAGAPLQIRSRLLAGDGKRMRIWHEMTSGDRLLATGEHMLLHVDLETRRVCDAEPAVAAAMRQLAEAQAALPEPDGAGRAVGQPR
ncbi:3-hydroxyacyl-CoA dehydrogenase [Oceanicola sp. 22II-s10i]|uniref:carnitine 3-dehydrogenase n=1 Tax=Oceanicola sp. 22II-s10i TaxID=1317116 RepID=UPI000B528B3F|nr:carnitine 3-dehydrogenase [Oceanicola sp. 22II-s10i]OWU82886.1 3-hydroxyacyl-CoA dehydrogenase [Oceanicola sp. 22II-s10i]